MEAATRKHALVGECISRASVEAATGATIADIDAAIATCDYERAATCAFALARAGTPAGSDVIARILPGIELPAITCSLLAIAPDRAALLELVERDRFPQTRDGGELEALVLFAAWRAGAPSARVIPPLRRLSARSLTAESYALLATIAASIDDPNVAAATKPISAFAKEYAKHVVLDEKAMTASLTAVMAELPPEVIAPTAAGFTVRGAKQPGRNEPCPCGSGNKFKKCCADKPVSAPSPIPGVSWDDFLGPSADRITPEHVAELPLKELVRIDVQRLQTPCVYYLFRRFVVAREWQHARRVTAEAERRELGNVEDYHRELVVGLLPEDEQAARAYLAKLPAELAQDFDIDLVLRDKPEAAYRMLVDKAHEALVGARPFALLELAHALLRAEPVLGIVFARACLGSNEADDGETLLEVVEEARDQLNLPPVDAAWAVLDELIESAAEDSDDEDDDDSDDDDEPATSALAAATARVDQLERTLAQMRSELDAARTRPAAELMRPSEAESGLETRVRELEALIREGNAERRELRAQLEKTRHREPDSERREGPRARRVTLDEPDDDMGDTLEPGARDISIPRFERRFTDALGDVPATVAAEAMRTIGTLTAGDGFAWKGVKQAKDMTRPVLMARVGIHHRLLFRVEDGVMDVLDLITREQLLTTLKRLRAAR